MSTATTHGAQAHARSQAGTQTPFQPTVPASAATGLPSGVGGERVISDETIGAGCYAVHRLPRGAAVRLTDVDGDACANVLVFNALHPSERLNVADTVKVQWQAYPGAGTLLLSDMGRALMSIAADTSAHHDALCGASNERRNAAKYGTGAVHGPCPNARDRFAVALAKFGLARRDIPPCINFFKGVRVEPSGALEYTGGAGAGTYVELRAELPVLLAVVNTPHVLDPRTDYTATALRITSWRAQATDRNDPRWASTPEAERAFLNTEAFLHEWDASAVSNTVLVDEVIEARAPWAYRVPAGYTLRIVDLEGNQAVDFLVYNADDPVERYSVPDTIVEQGNIFLITGSRLMSNEGRSLMTVTATTCDRHDTIGGACSQESNTLRYGFHTKQQHACVENFLLALSAYDLGKRDMTSNVNWFMNVPVEPDGTLGIVDGISGAGLSVDLRADMDVLAVISNCPQINNPCNAFNPTPVRVVVTH